MRSALVWLGCADPALSMEAAREDDPELGELREMIGVWSAAFGSDAMTCKAAVGAAMQKTAPANEAGESSQYAPQIEERYPGLHQMLLQIAGVRGNVDSNRLGRWLLSRHGRVVGDLRFKKDGVTAGSARWKLERVAVKSRPEGGQGA